MRSLRECKDLLGEPITCLRVAPTDRRLFVRTAADRVAAVDVSFFAATHTFDCDGGARGTMRAIRGAGVGGGGALRGAEGAFAGSAASGAASAGRPLARFALSPDGRWMVAGAADGSGTAMATGASRGRRAHVAARSSPLGCAERSSRARRGCHAPTGAALAASTPLPRRFHAVAREEVAVATLGSLPSRLSPPRSSPLLSPAPLSAPPGRRRRRGLGPGREARSPVSPRCDTRRVATWDGGILSRQPSLSSSVSMSDDEVDASSRMPRRLAR